MSTLSTNQPQVLHGRFERTMESLRNSREAKFPLERPVRRNESATHKEHSGNDIITQAYQLQVCSHAGNLRVPYIL